MSALCCRNSVHPSIRPSVPHTDGSVKTVEVRIMQFSPYSSPVPLVFAGKFHPEILTGSPCAGASHKGGLGKQTSF